MVGSLALGACGTAGEDATAAPTSAESTAATELALQLDLVHDAGRDGFAGVTRNNDEEGNPCTTTNFTRPTDALAFMEPGAEVLIEDAAGTIVGKATLDVGRATNINGETNAYLCTWSLAPVTVPESTFYTVRVGANEVATLSRDEVVDGGALTIDLRV
jgi:hypothetical protein